MTHFDKPPRYKSFLLTLWEERGQRSTIWRFGLEDPETGQRQAFAGLEALTTALQKMISAVEAKSASRASFTLPRSEPSEADDY